MIFIMLFFEMASRLEETIVDMLTKARCHVMGTHSSPESRQHVERPTWRGSIPPVPHGQPWWGAPYSGSYRLHQAFR